MKIKPEIGTGDIDEDEDEDFDEAILDFVTDYSNDPGFGNYDYSSSVDGSKRMRMQTNTNISTQGRGSSPLSQNPTQNMSKNAEQARLNRLKKKEESYQRKNLLHKLRNSVKESEQMKDNLEATLKNQRNYNLYLKLLLQNKDNLAEALQNLPGVSQIHARGFILPHTDPNDQIMPSPSDTDSPLCLHITGSTAQIELCQHCSQKFRTKSI